MGNLGSGKTLGATIFAYYLYFRSGEKMKLRANYYLAGAKKIRDLQDLYRITNSIIVLDEIHTIIDSRTWKYNKKILDFILQFRKYNNYLIFTTQHIKQVDVRLRNITQHLFLCERKKDFFKYTLIDTLYKTVLKIYKVPFEKAKIFFPLYSTFEEIKPLKKKKKKYIPEEAKDLIGEMELRD